MSTPSIIATLRQWSVEFQRQHGQLPPVWLVDPGEYAAAVRWMENQFSFSPQCDNTAVFTFEGLPFRIVKDGYWARVDALSLYPATNPNSLPPTVHSETEHTRKIVLKLPQSQRNALVKAANRRGHTLSAFMLKAAFAAAGVPQDAPCRHEWQYGFDVAAFARCRRCGSYSRIDVLKDAPCVHDWVANYVGTGVTCVPFCRLCGATQK